MREPERLADSATRGRSRSAGTRLTAHASKTRASHRQEDVAPPPVPDSGASDGADYGTMAGDGSFANCTGGGCAPGSSGGIGCAGGAGCSGGIGCAGGMGCDSGLGCDVGLGGDLCGASIPCGPCDQLWFGFEAVFVKPYFGCNPALISTFSDSVTVIQEQQEFSYSQNLSPRAWLGYQSGSGLGVRARYWQYDTNAETVTDTSAGFTDTISAPFHLPLSNDEFGPSTIGAGERWTTNSGLQTQSIDIEGTKNIQFCSWSLLAGAGIRYAKIHQNYDGTLLNDNGALSADVHYNHGIDGVGPSFSFEARRPLGCRLSLYSAARASLLVGNSVATLNVREQLDQTFAQPSTVVTTRCDGPLTIGELQVGAEWTSNCWLLGGQVFFRGAFEAQTWQNVGNATSTDGDLIFLGGSVLAGMKY